MFVCNTAGLVKIKHKLYMVASSRLDPLIYTCITLLHASSMLNICFTTYNKGDNASKIKLLSCLPL